MPRRATHALLGALAGVALLLTTWFAAFHVGILQRADASILGGFVDLHRPRIDSIAQFLAHLGDPKPFSAFGALLVLAALARRRPKVALAIVAILLAANATTQLLKPLLPEPRPPWRSAGVPPIPGGSWPSGHATAAMSLALCAILAAPARLRPPLAVIGSAFAVAVSYSFLTLNWHYPSDVIGGFLVAATWTLLGVAAVFAADARWPRRVPGEPAKRLSVREALAPPVATLLGALALVGLVALARPRTVTTYARDHETFVLGAAAIAVLSLTLATGFMLALRSTGNAPAPTGARRPDSRHG